MFSSVLEFAFILKAPYNVRVFASTMYICSLDDAGGIGAPPPSGGARRFDMTGQSQGKIKYSRGGIYMLQ